MVFSGENMIISNSITENNLSEYFIKNNKINIDIRDNKLFKMSNGLYENDSSILTG